MKKLFAFLLACVCTLALFGCAGANDDKSDGGPEDDWAPLTEAQMFEDLSATHAGQTATTDTHPFLGLKEIYIHPCRHAQSPRAVPP